MTGPFDHGNPVYDLQNIRGRAEAKAGDIPQPAQHARETSRWPSAGTVARAVLALVVGLIAFGWILTAINDLD